MGSFDMPLQATDIHSLQEVLLKMNIAICDDIHIHLDILEGSIRKCTVLAGELLSIDRYSCELDLLKTVNSGKQYTFVFLDINMPNASGLDVYTKLAHSDTSIVFVSTHIELLPEAFTLYRFRFTMGQKRKGCFVLDC